MRTAEETTNSPICPDCGNAMVRCGPTSWRCPADAVQLPEPLDIQPRCPDCGSPLVNGHCDALPPFFTMNNREMRRFYAALQRKARTQKKRGHCGTRH
jgi:hypothetical protein